MKKSLKKRLQEYSTLNSSACNLLESLFKQKNKSFPLLTGVVLLLSYDAVISDVVYTDCDDFTRSGTNTGTVDLDGDENADFWFKPMVNSCNTNAHIQIQNGYCFKGYNKVVSDSSFIFVSKLEKDVTVNATGIKCAAGGMGRMMAYRVGPWANQSNKYIGVRFSIGSDTHYGWIRVSTTNAYSVTVHGYAWENTPNTAIVTGDEGTPSATPGLWTGATNNDWNTASNWDDGNVPTFTVDVVIPDVSSGSNRYPELNAIGVCQNITIENGASLTITGTETDLEIYGNFIMNNGSSITNAGELVFRGEDCHLDDQRDTKTNLGNIKVD